MPQNHKRTVCDLTVADRLALYDHVVAVLNRQKEAASSGQDDLYVDLVSKLQKGEKKTLTRRFVTIFRWERRQWDCVFVCR